MSICSIASASLTPGFAIVASKRIEIHHHQVDRLDAVRPRRGFVLLVPAQVEQRAVHLRVQRLHPAIEHFRESGEVGNVARLDSCLPQQARRAAGGNDFDALFLELAREIGHAGFVGNRNESAFDFHDVFRCTRT